MCTFARKTFLFVTMLFFRFVARWMFKLLMWGCIISLVWVAFSCEEFCEEPNRTAVVVTFYTTTSDLVSLVSPVNVTIWGIENDSLSSLLYGTDHPLDFFKQRNLSQVLLPVNPSADSMSYSIQNGDLPADTILIRYRRHNGFISPQCGCVTYAEIEGEPEITLHSMKRMVVTNPNAATVSYRQGIANAENIRIYY